ncbi:EAL domain-containing protein [Parahaliea maris]|uniref:EAL domain-containing protein n=1 Tax=Parahaliea maris TaxID=2716870 RepID=A0A5C8ZKF1_9GAMM|nr:EAL domain-containing protein [Parahaliea maris]TXS88938.1 EAL domain-containing protein [Parahaliea maris]
MSLFKQLWIAIIFLLVLVFGGSFVVNSLSAKRYLEQQLYMKNSDNATALALSLTQQDADPVLLELTLSAQYDTGHYEMIELVDPEGNVIIRRVDSQTITDAPGWFMSLLPIEVEAGQAEVQKGWQQVGTLTLRSHSRFAYRELWKSTQKLALVFLVAMILAGLLGNYLLRIILRPLDDVVTQAEAIGERRFITIDEPYTLEFRKVVAAMNNLSARIQKVLREEARRLEKWQRQAHIDKVTGLTNREPFMQTLEAALESDDVNATGSLVLLRVSGLAQLNQLYGRKTIDGLLSDIGKALNGIVATHSRWASSRLNGSDFALLAPRSSEPGGVAREIQEAVREVFINRSMESEITLPVATTVYVHGETIAELMTRLDGALLSAEKAGQSEVSIAYKGDVQMLPMREQMKLWRNILQQSFRQEKFALAAFPVVDLKNKLIHLECPARLEWDGETMAAGTFLPWVNRLEMSSELDQHVIDLALRMITIRDKPLAINLSVAAVVEPGFPMWMSERLSSHPSAAAMLWMEVPEAMAFRHLDNFKRLCERAKAYGARMGIEHVGHQLSEIGQLHDVGLDYLKVDASFVRDVDSNVANQTLLRTLCTVGHSVGVKVFAEGVRSEDERKMLKELGIDGVTGPFVQDHE